MTNGGMLQLVAYGTQDLYLTSKPQITFWKSVHKRHTLFAIESTKQEINGDPDFGRKFTCTIAKNGDLLYKMLVEVELPDINEVYRSGAGPFTDVQYSFSYVNDVGMMLLKSVELDIGGQKIERHIPEWCDSWTCLTVPANKRSGFNRMVGHYDDWSPSDSTKSFSGSIDEMNRRRTLYIPLQFFFNRHQGLAIPLVAMSFHDIKLHFELESVFNLVVMTSNNTTVPEQTKRLVLSSIQDKIHITTFTIYTDMVFLDTVERDFFSQTKHEYLIEQVQYLGEEMIPNAEGSSILPINFRVPIPFVNPVKELVWVFVDDSVIGDQLAYLNLMDSARLVMNGNDRFSERTGDYFSTVQPWNHHTTVPTKPIYVYSFSTAPEEWQPSGTCNFSKIDSCQLFMKIRVRNNDRQFRGKLKVFAMSYNILRIMDGLAGLASHS